MPTDVCLTPRILQEALKQILTSEVGTYTFRDAGGAGTGFVMPAISIGKPPDEAIVDGLEIILPLYPYTPDNISAGAYNFKCQYWDIKLIARNYAAKASLVAAVENLSRRFYCCNIVPMAQRDAIGDYEMVVITFKHNSIVKGLYGTQKEFIEPAAASL